MEGIRSQPTYTYYTIKEEPVDIPDGLETEPDTLIELQQECDSDSPDSSEATVWGRLAEGSSEEGDLQQFTLLVKDECKEEYPELPEDRVDVLPEDMAVTATYLSASVAPSSSDVDDEWIETDSCHDEVIKKQTGSPSGYGVINDAKEIQSRACQEDCVSFTGRKSHASINSSHCDGGLETESVHTRNDLQCSYCNETFTNKSVLESHTCVHTEDKERPLQCPVCSKAFTLKAKFSDHMRLHNARERPYECSVCEKTFVHVSKLTSHLATHTGERPHKCSVCSHTFTQKSLLSAHMRIHTREGLHSCSFCNKTFLHLSRLTRHIRIHTGERPYKCSVCSRTFTRKNSLTLHACTTAPSEESQVQCSVCDKTFVHITKLKEHMKTHIPERPHKCSDCGKAFLKKGLLTAHMTIHTGERPHNCPVCDKAFRRRRTLKYHMIVHNRESPYQCSVCDLTFIGSYQMRTHMRIHTGERPYQCTVCGKTFTQKKHINWTYYENTLQRASKQKYHTCKQCNKTYKYADDGAAIQVICVKQEFHFQK